MRTNVWVPDELMGRVRTEHPDVNVSAVLQAGLRALWSCTHDVVACACCGKPLHREELERAALVRFWRVLTVRLELAVAGRQTAQGAARAVKECAVEHGVAPAALAPQIRPTRAEREPWRARRAV